MLRFTGAGSLSWPDASTTVRFSSGCAFSYSRISLLISGSRIETITISSDTSMIAPTIRNRGT